MTTTTRSIADALDLLTSAKPTETVALIAQQMRVMPANVLVAAPDDACQAMEIAETLLRTGTIDMLVVDATLCGGAAFARVLAEAARRSTALVLAY